MVLRCSQRAGQIVVRLPWRNRRHQAAADQNTEQEDDDPSHGRPRCGMAARRLGGNLARISGSVYGGTLDLAAGTIEAWHAMTAACGSGASANVGDVDDAAAVDRAGNADARGRSRRPDR